MLFLVFDDCIEGAMTSSMSVPDMDGKKGQDNPLGGTFKIIGVRYRYYTYKNAWDLGIKLLVLSWRQREILYKPGSSLASLKESVT